MALSIDKYGSRHLRTEETLFHHFAYKYNCCIYSHLATISSSNQLAPGDVKKAFMILAQQQEALRMRIVPSKDEHLSYKFSLMDDPSLMNMRVVQLRKKSDWPNVINEESRIQMDCYNGPLWRVVMANVEEVEKEDNEDNGDYMIQPNGYQCIIFLVFHHAISDGTSGFDVLYQQFLPILSALVNRGDADILPDIALGLSTEERLSLSTQKGTCKPVVPVCKQVSLYLKRWISRNFNEPYVYEKNYCFPEETKRCSSDIVKEPPCMPFIFNEELTSSIMKSAKKRGVTVHSILLAISSAALCATAQEAEVTLPENVIQCWPVNLRKYFGLTTPQPLAVHIYFGVTETKRKTDYNIEEFWKICIEVHKDVKKQRTNEFAKSWLTSIQYFLNESRKKRLHVVMNESGGTSLVGLSNLGICDSNKPTLTQGEIKLDMAEEYFAAAGLRHFHAMPFFHCVSTFKDKMFWTTSYDTNIISQKFMQRYVEKMKEISWKYCSE